MEDKNYTDEIKEMLLKQLRLLSRLSEKCDDYCWLLSVTEAMVHIAETMLRHPEQECQKPGYMEFTPQIILNERAIRDTREES